MVSASISFKLTPSDRAEQTAPVEASDDPAVVHSANITTDEESVEPAATTVTGPAPSAIPEAPLEAEAQQGAGISSMFRSSLYQLATMLSPARERPLPAPTVTTPQSQQDDPILPVPVTPIPKPSPLSIPSPGISPISSGDEASAVLALQAALALQEAKLTQFLTALAAQEARAAARVIPAPADTTVEAAVDLSAITAQALVELLKRSSPKSLDDDGDSSSSDDSSNNDSYGPVAIPDKPRKQSNRKARRTQTETLPIIVEEREDCPG